MINKSKLFLLFVILSVGCSDEAMENRRNLLTDGRWWYVETVGTSPSGYTSVSPLAFELDGTVTIGAGKATWTFTDKGKFVKVTFPSQGSHREAVTLYEIVNLSESEFHFRQHSTYSSQVVEMKYGKDGLN